MGGGLPLLIAIFFRGGIGGGDIKLLAVVGWFLGLKLTCLSLLLSFLSAGFVGLMLMVLKIKGIKDTIPFGPFIALGSFISLLVGEEIIAWYLGLFF